jgi:alpha-aminoadipic semialdehyde synthase
MQPIYYVGIRAEDKSVWERRTPLSPDDIKDIMEKNNDIQFIVQSSRKRIFSDAEYQAAGAKIVNKLE